MAPVAEAGSMEDVSDILAGAGSMEDVSDILAGAGSMEDVSDILAEAGSMEDVSDILLEAPAPADSRGGARDAHDASQAPAWDPDRNHRAGVTVADIVSTHVKAGSHADADEPVSCVRRPSVVQRQQRWRKGGNISRRVSHAVQMVLPEHLTFTIDFQALETFRKHPNEESFGAALNNKTSLVTIETFFAVLSVAFAIGDLEGATEAEHLAFRSLLTLCSLVTLFCSNNALLIANVLKEKGEFFKPQLRWWQQEGSWVQVVLLITKLFHVPPGVPAWAVDPKWQLWVFLRLVILASFMREYCPTVRSKLVRTVTKLTKINVANSLVFKWYIKVYPFRIFTAIYVYLVFATGSVCAMLRAHAHARTHARTHTDACADHSGACARCGAHMRACARGRRRRNAHCTRLHVLAPACVWALPLCSAAPRKQERRHQDEKGESTRATTRRRKQHTSSRGTRSHCLRCVLASGTWCGSWRGTTPRRKTSFPGTSPNAGTLTTAG